MSDHEVEYLTKSGRRHRKNGIKHWEKARKILLMQRFLDYARNKVMANKIEQECIDQKDQKDDEIVKTSKILILSRYFFELLVSLINVYLSYKIPFRLAFFNDHRVPELFIHDLVLDSILFISFVMRILSEKEKKSRLVPVKDKLRYFNYFMHLRFYTDLLSIIPLYMLNNKWYWFKIGRLLRVNSLISFLWTFKPPWKRMRNFMVDNYSTLNHIWTILTYLNMIGIVCHCIACLWFYIPNQLSTPNELTWLGEGWENYSISDNYMRSLYWTAVTFSSVGYGDITGKTTQEYIYSMFVEFLGIMCFAYFMGSLTSLISAYQSKQEKTMSRENELTQWLIFVEDHVDDKETQIALNGKISSYFHHKWACDPTSISGFEDYFMMLPPELSYELSSHLFGHRLLIFESFLQKFPEIQFEIASKLQTEKFLAPCEILKNDSKNKNIYLITSGNIFIGIQELGYCLSLSNGAYFGEDSAIFGDESQVSFYSSGEALLYYFNFTELKKIFKRSKQQIWDFSKLAFKRSKYFLEMTKFKYSSGFYVTDQEFSTFSKQFDLEDLNFSLDEDQEFNERAKNFIEKFYLKKKDDNDITKKIFQGIKKSSEKFGKDLQNAQKKYEDDLKDVISRVDKAIYDIKNT